MDFTAAVKYLDKVASRKATIDESQYDKYFSTVTSRDIKKLHYYLELPAQYYTYAELSGLPVPRMLFQYNITLPAPSYILSMFSPRGYIRSGVLCVKWRVGETVYRYRILSGPGSAPATGQKQPTDLVYFPAYDKHRIPVNCVIEYWLSVDAFFTQQTAGVLSPFLIKLSRLTNPETAEELSKIVNTTALDIPTLGFDLPAEIPVAQPTLIYETN